MKFEWWGHSSELGQGGGRDMISFRMGHFRHFLQIWSVWVVCRSWGQLNLKTEGRGASGVGNLVQRL